MSDPNFERKILKRLADGDLGSMIRAEETEDAHQKRDAKVATVKKLYRDAEAAVDTVKVGPKREAAADKVAQARAELVKALKEQADVEWVVSLAHSKTSQAMPLIRELEAECDPKINDAIADLYRQIGTADTLKVYETTTGEGDKLITTCTNELAVAALVRRARNAVTQLELLRRESGRDVEPKIAAIVGTVGGV